MFLSFSLAMSNYNTHFFIGSDGMINVIRKFSFLTQRKHGEQLAGRLVSLNTFYVVSNTSL